MAKTLRKVHVRLDARNKDYQATCARLEAIKSGSSLRAAPSEEKT